MSVPYAFLSACTISCLLNLFQEISNVVIMSELSGYVATVSDTYLTHSCLIILQSCDILYILKLTFHLILPYHTSLMHIYVSYFCCLALLSRNIMEVKIGNVHCEVVTQHLDYGTIIGGSEYM